VTDTRGIDRFFDAVDSLVDKTDRVLNRTKYIEEKHKDRRGHVKVVEEPKAPASAATAITSRRFRIIEAVDAQSGDTIFVVTDGKARAECSTRELAEKILRAVETAP
jgi:hypothetical protein